MKNTRKGTVCFILENNKVLLILIEYHSGDRKWTGIGGFAEEGELLEDAVVREANEESFIELKKEDLKKVAELNGPIQMNVFITHKWSGELRAKEDSLKEFKWFSIDELPFSQMHEGSEQWLPKVLEGKLVKSENSQITAVDNFE